MVRSWIKGKTADVIFGVAVPSIVALIIVVAAALLPASLTGLKYILLEAVVVIAVPMLIGLVWNQWAGGSAGFLLGSLYALYFSDQLYMSQGSGDIILLGNLVSAMLMGYIAGALNKRSDKYRDLLVAGLASGIMGSLIVVLASQFSPTLKIGTAGIALVFLPRILAGFLVPLIAKAFLQHKKPVLKIENEASTSS